MRTATSPVLARRALAALVTLSRGALLAAAADVVREPWLRRAILDAGDVRVLGCYQTTNRAKEAWPCCVLQISKDQGLGAQAKVQLVAVYFSEEMHLAAQAIGTMPARFLGSANGRAGVLNGDDAKESTPLVSPASAPPAPRPARPGPAPAPRRLPFAAARSPRQTPVRRS